MASDLNSTVAAMGQFTRRMEISVVALAAVVGVLVWVQFADPFAWHPLHNPSPQRIVGEPVVKAGEGITIMGTKCNTSSDPVGVSGSVYLVRLDPAPRLTAPYFSGQAVREPGCQTNTWLNEIPADLEPGLWRLEGLESAQRGNEIVQEPWYSEPFTVTAP